MLKLVIAEDEDVIRDGLINYIDWNLIGYEFAGEASNGREAVEVINKVKPDVLLTDIKMPYMDGLTLVEEMKQQYPDLYFIILTGHDEFEYARRALKSGVYEYILKPINITHLKEILSKVKSDYEKRQSSRDEYKKLKEIEQESKLQIRKKIFSDILIDHIPILDRYETLSLLDKEPNENYFIVGVIEMQNLAMRTMDSDFLELIEIDREFGERVDHLINMIHSQVNSSAMNNEKDLHLFKSGNCERILCMEASSPQMLESRMSRLLSNIKSNQDELFHVILSYGSIHKGMEGLVESHMEARATQEKTNTKAWTNVLYPENPNSKPLNFADFDTSLLARQVQTGTRAGIDAELLQLENTLKQKEMTSHMLVIMVISDIFFQIIKLPEGVEGYSNEILENPMHYYQKIIHQKDISGVFYYLKKVCYMVNDFFADVNSGKFVGVLKRALDYIDNNYAKEDLMIKDVAQYAYVSSSYLSIILKKEMGITFIEYLTKVRMEHAKKLLEQTNMKHYEIAEACGYPNSTYFSTIFKRFYGVSPSGYLSNLKSEKEE
jgi:YesN/AraC family two-component response regulator